MRSERHKFCQEPKDWKKFYANNKTVAFMFCFYKTIVMK